MSEKPIQREVLECDVAVVGAGPAGLCAAIRILQMAKDAGRETSVYVIEKGSEVGAHILSGAVLDTRALDELLPEWEGLGTPLSTVAGEESFLYLTGSGSVRLPVPPPLRNTGCRIVSLGMVCRWLAGQAEALGATVLPGFSATEVLLEDGAVRGVATGDMGVDAEGNPTPQHQAGVEIRARQTIFAEGCRGSLTLRVVKELGLDEGRDPQTYGIGIKELWEVPQEQSSPGAIVHTVGWPLSSDTYGGSFLYHLEDSKVVVGLVVGLDYRNPHLSPYWEFQRLKHHPRIRRHLEGGRRIGYGARALNEGGVQSVPKLSFPGGCLAGCGPGFMNVARLKGTHTAMKSGMLAAEAVFAVIDEPAAAVPGSLDGLVRSSWIWRELRKVRNIRPAFRAGFFLGMAHAALDAYVLRGNAPWTLSQKTDHDRLRPAGQGKAIDYPKPDGKISFDRESSVYLAGISHEENQPNHLLLERPELAIDVNYKMYGSPETLYCPAGVYEIIQDGEAGKPRLRINSQNCVHCKTCDIKDPRQNITWVPPEGGSGPNYSEM